MKSSLLFVCFVLLSIGSFAQSKLNLGFEDLEKGLPKNWETLGSEKYKVLVDSLNKVSGKYSLAFEGNGTSSDFKALYISLPANYDGKEMRLSGFIKSKGINDGSAGLYIRVDPNLAFDNMESRAVKGSVDWTKFEITVPLSPKETSTITVGVYLIGSGKVWFDDLNITVDDKELDQAKVFEKEIMPAELDKEFDEGSKISFTSLDNNKVNDLELLGKIWGFVKYHHPEVAKGKYNWDYELFRVLPTYLEAKNLSSRNDILATWLARFGTVAPCGSCTNNKDVAHQSDFSWMENSELSASVKGKLNEILVGRNQGEHYYIALHKNIGNPDFKNEKAYASMPYPDAGFRLLALYKYWNMIEYFFPYKYQTDKKWNAVLKEYVPVFLNAKDELEYELAVLKIIGDIKDTHANLWGGGNKISQLRGKNYAPFRVGFSESKLVVTDIYNPELLEADEIKIGDVITHINGKDVTAIVDSLKTFYPASNEAAQLRDISLELLRSAESNIQLEYVSGDKTQQKSFKLYEREKLKMYHWYKVNEEEKCYKMLNDNIGYVSLANIKQEDIPVIKEKFKDTKGMIIDIRNYPSTFVPFALGSFFVSKPTPFVKFTMGNPNNPGEFFFGPSLSIENAEHTYKGNLVVLLNELSQSQAEYTAMAFRAGDRTKIVGSTTSGADGNVSNILLPGGLSTMISGIGVYYPNGKQTQRIGIVPDVEVKPSVMGIKAGKDEVLEKAIEILKK